MTTEEYNLAVDKYADGIFRFILKNLKQEERSRDVVQDTFEKFWVKKDTVDPSKVKTYLFTTAYHTMIDTIRKDKRIDHLDHVQENNYSHNNQYSDLKEVIDRALDKLPEMQKTIILLRDYEGYSYKEIGEIMDISESNVKIQIFRGRMILKDYLKSIETLI
ncbi:RNA polymerase sigma factor [Bacteroidales bacterium]|nr:RNA polymerase sigma factor [Bacteroidales bacterium]